MEKKMQKRTELHLHTNVSEDFSLITPRAAVKQALQRGLKTIAITDRNSVQNFHSIAYFKTEGLKVIYGAELFRKPDTQMTVLVKNMDGLKPLYKLLSGKSITDQERKHLLFGTQNPTEGSDYDYIELLVNTDPEQNRQLYELGRKLGNPVVAVGNCHYLSPDRRVGKKVLDVLNNRPPEKGDTHLRTTEEMLAHFAYLGADAAYEVVITNPDKIAEEIGFVNPDAIQVPAFTLPDAEAEVRRICQEKLQALYGEQPQIQARLEQELALLGENISMLLLCHKIVKHVQEKGALTGFRGYVGSILAAWLLDISDINPLPAHYRCPACKHTEFARADSGYDLPAKNCPHCGNPMTSDGQNIPFETFTGPTGETPMDIDLNMTDAMRECAIQFLEDLLGIDRLAAAGYIGTYLEKAAQRCAKWYAEQTDDHIPEAELTQMITGVKRHDSCHPVGIMLLPEGMEWEDVTPMRHCDDRFPFATHFEYHQLEGKLTKLDIMSVGYYDLLQELFATTGVQPSDIDYQDPAVYKLFRELDADEIPEFSSPFARELLAFCDDICFSGLIKVCSMTHGTEVWCNNGEHLFPAHSFRELIGNRDDVFQTLLRYGADRETAWQAMTATRKGRFDCYSELTEKLLQTGVPAWYLDSMRKIRYLFPKAHAVHYVKLGYMAAWFKVYYPEAFSKAILKRKPGVENQAAL